MDGNGDCLRDNGEPPLEGVTIELRDAGGRRIAQTTTDANGRYRFENLAPGRYQIFEQQPDGLFHGGQTVGSGDGEVLGADLLAVNLRTGESLVEYNFCELAPAEISGFVYVDDDGDCERDPGERALEGVAIELRDGNGNIVARTTTNAEGRYHFGGLAPGSYQIFEQQPDGWFQGGQTVGSGGGEVLGDDLLAVDLRAGQSLVDYNFCELAPSEISGVVYVDDDGDCERDPEERARGSSD